MSRLVYVSACQIPASGPPRAGSTATLDLSGYAGETLAAFGLAPSTTNETGQLPDYQMNLGEVSITDGSLPAPTAPTGLKVDREPSTPAKYLPLLGPG